MESYNPKTANTRYQFLPSDNVTLYRKFSHQNGVDVRQRPEYNVHDWMDPLSPNFQQEISNAIFHYSARSERSERFQVCISTKEMNTAAWKYAHQSQLVLDGTFGVCTSRLLLFIALAQDENRKGVPLAFFLFSAPTGNKATHAGYNTEILKELLSHWHNNLNRFERELRDKPSGSKSESFMPYIAVTDTDTKERGALRECHGLPWGFPGKPAPAPVKTRTRSHGYGFSRVRVRVFEFPQLLVRVWGYISKYNKI